MKKIYQILAIAAIVTFLAGLSSCSASKCGCPGKTFDVGKVYELE